MPCFTTTLTIFSNVLTSLSDEMVLYTVLDTHYNTSLLSGDDLMRTGTFNTIWSESTRNKMLLIKVTYCFNIYILNDEISVNRVLIVHHIIKLQTNISVPVH